MPSHLCSCAFSTSVKHDDFITNNILQNILQTHEALFQNTSEDWIHNIYSLQSIQEAVGGGEWGVERVVELVISYLLSYEKRSFGKEIYKRIK